MARHHAAGPTDMEGTLSRMCGICGLYAASGRPPAALVDAMRARIRHRGPDQGSTDAFGPCVLGHQRLVVLDPELGYQPVANEQGDVVAVFNGELYNFAELRADLAVEGPRRARPRRHAGHPAPVRGVRAALRRAARGDVRDRALGRAARPARARARPARQEAARLDAPRRRDARVRVGAEGAARAAGAAPRAGPRRARRVSRAPVRPRRPHRPARRPPAAARARCSWPRADGADRALLGAAGRPTTRSRTAPGWSGCGRPSPTRCGSASWPTSRSARSSPAGSTRRSSSR